MYTGIAGNEIPNAVTASNDPPLAQVILERIVQCPDALVRQRLGKHTLLHVSSFCKYVFTCFQFLQVRIRMC